MLSTENLDSAGPLALGASAWHRVTACAGGIEQWSGVTARLATNVPRACLNSSRTRVLQDVVSSEPLQRKAVEHVCTSITSMSRTSLHGWGYHTSLRSTGLRIGRCSTMITPFCTRKFQTSGGNHGCSSSTSNCGPCLLARPSVWTFLP